MRNGQDNIGDTGHGLDKRILFRGIYNLPGGMTSYQRLALRSRHLHELAVELEQAIQNEVPPDILSVYSWAIDTISAEIKLISDRLEVQSKSRKS